MTSTIKVIIIKEITLFMTDIESKIDEGNFIFVTKLIWLLMAFDVALTHPDIKPKANIPVIK